jgi:raffinose/stachyose/melibiose transport system substrate-binding protein
VKATSDNEVKKGCTMLPKHHRARRGALVAIPVVGLLALAGCSGGQGGGDATNGGGGDAQSFSLSYATSNTLDSPFEQLAERYMEENPNVDITLNPTPNDQYDQTLRTQLQAGNASDVFATAPGSGQGRSIVPLAEAGFLAPLGDAATQLIPTGSEQQFQLDGETYGQALDITVASVVANMSAIDDNGLSYPADTDELFDACATLTDQGKSFFALAGAAPPNTGFFGMAVSATRVYAENPDWNQQRADGDVTFADDPGWQDALQTIVDAKDAGCFQPGVEGAGFDAITQGVPTGTSMAGFIPSGAVVNLLEVNADAQFLVQPFPVASSGDSEFIFASSNYSLSLNAASENAEAGQAFLDWIAEPENVGLFAEVDGSLPISGLENVDLAGTPYEEVAQYITDGAYGPLPSAGWPNASVYDALSTGVQGLLTGQLTPEAVLANMDAAWGD